MCEAGEVEVVVVGDGAAFEQQLGEGAVARATVRARDHTAQWRPARPGTDRGRDGIRAGREQELRDGEQLVSSAWVEVVPARRAGGMKRRPARVRVVTGGERRIAPEFVGDAVDVAEDHRGGEAVVGDRGRRVQQAGGAADAAADTRVAERVHLFGELEVPLLDLFLQPRPAREPVAASDCELRSHEVELVRDSPDLFDRAAVSRLG